MTSVAIVGHGPSMLMEEMGDIIDDCDIVVRLKETAVETLKYPKHYGTKTDIIGGSLTIAQKIARIPAEQYWVFLDSRHEDVSRETLASVPYIFSPKEVIMDKGLCDDWDMRYRSLRDDMDGPGHNHTSQGFKAILYALHFLEPERLLLAGFDNVMTGKFSWSVTRGPEWQHYPDHRWDVENRLLGALQANYPKTELGFLIPEEEACPAK